MELEAIVRRLRLSRSRKDVVLTLMDSLGSSIGKEVFVRYGVTRRAELAALLR
jgi:hypothetical protein